MIKILVCLNFHLVNVLVIINLLKEFVFCHVLSVIIIYFFIFIALIWRYFDLIIQYVILITSYFVKVWLDLFIGESLSLILKWLVLVTLNITQSWILASIIFLGNVWFTFVICGTLNTLLVEILDLLVIKILVLMVLSLFASYFERRIINTFLKILNIFRIWNTLRLQYISCR